jgi:hypothetical protein
MEAPMTEYPTYTVASLERILHGFERTYHMTSQEFMAAHVADDAERLAGISGFTRHSWTSFYAEWRDLTGSDGFAANVEHELALC